MTSLEAAGKLGQARRVVWVAGAAALLTLIPGTRCLAAASRSTSDSESPLAIVRAAVAHEVAAAHDDSIKHLFRARKQTAQGSQTRLYVETQQAMAGMTIAYDDHPLTPEQVHGEENRLAGLASSPEQLRRKHAQEVETADRTLRILKAFPNAFFYERDGTVMGTAEEGRPGVEMVRLKFFPNPGYRPPSHVEEVLVGMAGVLAIDPGECRIARIDGTLFKEVSFGWGILGHLDKGGHFLVVQRDVGDDSWEISRMALAFTGKILLFKTLAIKSEEVFSDFRRVPAGTTFAQGIEMLKAREASLAQNRSEAVNAKSGAH
ncbi:MAG: hypothetical protein ABSF59_09915 [Candidatus Sulfotelmatobacter sp.]|jgi:hypothetical protein